MDFAERERTHHPEGPRGLHVALPAAVVAVGQITVIAFEAQRGAARAQRYGPIVAETEVARAVQIEGIDAIALVATRTATHAQSIADEILVTATGFVETHCLDAQCDRAARVRPALADIDAARTTAQIDHATGAARCALRHDRHRKKLFDRALDAIRRCPASAARNTVALPAQTELILAHRFSGIERQRRWIGASGIALERVAHQSQRIFGERLAQSVVDHTEALAFAARPFADGIDLCASRCAMRARAVGRKRTAARAPAPCIVVIALIVAAVDANARASAAAIACPRFGGHAGLAAQIADAEDHTAGRIAVLQRQRSAQHFDAIE
jgi:hypothetical protein